MKTPLDLVTLSTNARPIWNQVYFANNVKDQWDMWLDGDFIHIREKGGDKEAIIHASQCWVQVPYDDASPVVLAPRKSRGRPKGARNKPKEMN